MNAIHTTTSAAVVPLTAVFGSKVGNYLSAAAPGIPDWVSPLLGPMGALIGTLLAIRWLLTRLDKVEIKSDLRDAERDNNMKIITTMVVQNQQVIEQNSETLTEVRDIIRNCAANKNRV